MLVEDHLLIRMGLVTVSQLHADIELVGEVEEGEEAVTCFRKCKPDVVLVDSARATRELIPHHQPDFGGPDLRGSGATASLRRQR